jgi:hypothetical protein
LVAFDDFLFIFRGLVDSRVTFLHRVSRRAIVIDMSGLQPALGTVTAQGQPRAGMLHAIVLQLIHPSVATQNHQWISLQGPISRESRLILVGRNLDYKRF